MNRRSKTIALLFIALFLSAPRAGAQTGTTLILGDGSGSMQGFANAAAPRMSALFQLLVRNSDAPRLSVLTMSRGGRSQIDDVAQSSAFGSKSRYQGNTDLVYAFRHIHQNEFQALLVTDGMQSEGMYLNVKDQLKQIVGDGWGVWLFAIKLPFDGVYDPEQQLNIQENKPVIEQCIKQDDPNANVTERKKESTRIFNYHGLRPLLIFVLAKTPDSGRQLTQRISANLNADPQLPAQVVELAPLVYRGVGFGDLQTITDYVRIEGSTERPIIHSDPLGERTKEIHLPIVWKNPPAPLVQAYEEVPRWNPNQPSWIEEPLDVITDDRQAGNEESPGKIKIRFVSELPWLRSVLCNLPFIACRSENAELLNLTIWTEFTKPETLWWRDLNSDTSWQCPSRVYKLSDLTDELSELSVARQTAAHQPQTKSLQLIVAPL